MDNRKVLDDLFLQYYDAKKEYKNWLSERAELDCEYITKFKEQKSESGRKQIDEEYKNSVKDMENKRKNIYEKLDTLELQIHELCPDFITIRIRMEENLSELDNL